ncbi:MAG: Na/Pi cotransporter family protein [Ruminococcaceae bacterium]|nr:Na/Pi cotransporter family protein [Oscillospiraceae bacterium]
MDVFQVLNAFSGLALLLFGMEVMGSGLEKVAGGKMQRILEKLTGSRFKGLLLGTFVTAIIQSSSATTVMVVGFVNSGIMKLTQAVGVIMGANIGTTMTSWIFSLAGIKGGGNVFLNLLKPSSFAPVFAVIGVVLYVFCKKSESKKNVGQIMIGFAVLMIGMNTMSDATSSLSEIPAFRDIMAALSYNPILGLLAGWGITAVIQSSSASVGILQALSATGLISFSAAIPIILGQNIGTCVTAMLASAGANRNAKRTAMIHLYFNVIGTGLFLLLFYGVYAIFPHVMPFYHDTINTTQIAVVHTLFNVLSTLILFPFGNLLVKLATLTLSDTKSKADEVYELLDDRFLNMPSVALEQCKKTLIAMAEMGCENIKKAIGLLNSHNADEYRKIYEMEDLADGIEDKLNTYLLKLTDRDLTAMESKQVSKLLHSVSDFERICDHSINIADLSVRVKEKEIVFSEGALKEIKVLRDSMNEILDLTYDVFTRDDYIMAENVEPLEETIDQMTDYLRENHISRLKSGLCTIESGVVFLDLLNNIERVADHCSNIAVYVIELKNSRLDAHGYLKEVKSEGSEDYRQMLEFYKNKYIAELD